MVETVNIHAARTDLSRLIDRLEMGEEIIIARAGRPVAKLVPIAAPPARRRLGSMAGAFQVSDNFDDPLPDDVLASFEGR
jgi:prevent-host-death family protein